MTEAENSIILRIPVRRFASGVTHYADVPPSFPCEVRHFIKDYLSPVGPVSALCGVVLEGNLVHMMGIGSTKTSPKACRMCVRFNDRDPVDILNPLPPAEVLAEIERRHG